MFKFTGLIVAALLIGTLFGGYFMLRHKQAQQIALATPLREATRARATTPPQVNVFEDAAFLRRSEAVIGGSVENVSDTPLPQLTLTIKLLARDGQREELKTVKVTSADLAPGARASYSVTVPEGVWSGAKVVRVASDGGQIEIPFKSLPGKERPREKPTTTARTIIVERPAKPKRGEEFLNTPDTPVIIK